MEKVAMQGMRLLVCLKGVFLFLTFFLMTDGVSYKRNDVMINWPVDLPQDVTDIQISGNKLIGNLTVPCLRDLTTIDIEKNRIFEIYFDCLDMKLERFLLSNTPTRTMPDFNGMGQLSVVTIASTRITAIDAVIMAPNVEEFSLTNSKLWRLHKDAFSAMTNLKYLYLSNNLIMDMPDLTPCTLLAKLYLDGNALTNLPADALTNLFFLEELHLEQNRIEGVFHLPTLPSLVNMYINTNRITQISFQETLGDSNWPLLELLEAQYNQLMGKMTLPYFPKVNKLRLDYNKINELSCDNNAACLPTLINLYLDGNDFKGVYRTPCFPSLKNMFIRSNSLTGIVFEAGDGTSCLPSLSSLYLYNNMFQIFDLLLFPQLITLNLNNNPISIILNICESNLRNLYMKNNALVKPYFLCFINSHLQILDLSNSPLSTLRVRGFEKLKKLYLASTLLIKVNLYYLPALVYLDMSNNSMTDLSWTGNIRDSIQTLDLSNNEITTLLLNTTSFPELVELFLDNNKITGKVVLECSDKLESVSLSNNNIYEVKVACSSIANLNIDGNNLVDFSEIMHLSLKSLAISTSALSDVQNSMTCDIPTIEEISLYQNNGSSTSFKVWSSLSDITINDGDLQNLILEFCDATEVNLIITQNPLEILPSKNQGVIKKMILTNTSVRSIDHLTAYPSMTRLQIEDGILGFINENAFEGCSELQYLSLHNNVLTKVPRLTATATALTYLDLSANGIDTMAATDLWNFTLLEELYMTENNLTELNVPYLPSLTKMKFSYNQIHALKFDSQFRGQLLPKLELLNLDSNQLYYIHRSFFYHTPVLDNLQLRNNLFDTIPDISVLSNILTSISINRCNLRNIDPLFGMLAIEYIYIGSNPINGPIVIRDMPSLLRFGADDTGVTAVVLKNLPNFETINIRNSGMRRIPDISDIGSDLQLTMQFPGSPIPWVTHQQLRGAYVAVLEVDSLICDISTCALLISYPYLAEQLTCSQHSTTTDVASLTKQYLQCQDWYEFSQIDVLSSDLLYQSMNTNQYADILLDNDMTTCLPQLTNQHAALSGTLQATDRLVLRTPRPSTKRNKFRVLLEGADMMCDPIANLLQVSFLDDDIVTPCLLSEQKAASCLYICFCKLDCTVIYISTSAISPENVCEVKFY